MKKTNIVNRGFSLSRPGESRILKEQFVLHLEHGLHARPCALMVKTLRPFRCQAEVEVNGQKANGHSIMGLMTLAAADGSKMAFTLSGPDAPQAMTAVRHLFETNFEEAYHAPLVQSFSS